MAVTTVPTCEPTVLTAGDSWWWDKALSDYPPSDGYALSYVFTGPATFTLAAATSDDGDYFEVRGTPAANAARTAGNYRLQGYVTLSTTERWQVYDGRVEMFANPATASGSNLTFAETMLAALEAALEARSVPEYESLEINGRAVKYMSRSELIKEHAVWALRVQAERGTGGPMVVRTGARFVSPERW